MYVFKFLLERLSEYLVRESMFVYIVVCNVADPGRVNLHTSERVNGERSRRPQ